MSQPVLKKILVDEIFPMREIPKRAESGRNQKNRKVTLNLKTFLGHVFYGEWNWQCGKCYIV
jgi:hypothetical protein